ncbi:MAG: hypothetical protein K0S65_5794 [Labilithrix sp.]|nr:hypothetical protein [Labilithrix sp.]
MGFEQDETFRVREGRGGQLRSDASVNRRVSASGVGSTLNIHASAARIEVEDAFFNHDSAVMMPDTVVNRRPPATETFHAADSEFMALLERFHPEVHRTFTTDPPDPKGEPARHVSGLGVLAAAYRFLALNPSFRLLLAGHCDTTGEPEYNFKLSELRAKNVLFLLQGDRRSWIASALEHSQVEDQKRICNHAARERGWPCDPGLIDNEADARLTRALRAFRENFNRDFGRSIPLDGPAGRETWGAFFDVYMDELAGMLGTQVDGLDTHRAELRFIDDTHRFLACGEKLPIDASDRDGFRSEENRRVEMLFFSTKALPDFNCHAGGHPFCMRTCSRNECGVYSPELFSFIPIDPGVLGAVRRGALSQGKLEIIDAEDDLQKLADKPDEQYVTRAQVRDVDASHDPWAFLDSFMDLDPDHTQHETRHDRSDGGGSEVA